MFFLTLIMWLVMRWQDEAENLSGEKYLILIAYLIGLSLGVHLLALLTIFPVLMIVYFRRYEVSRQDVCHLRTDCRRGLHGGLSRDREVHSFDDGWGVSGAAE